MTKHDDVALDAGGPDRLWIWFADNGNIRKWQREPFEEGTEFIRAYEAHTRPAAERGAETEAIIRRDGFFLTLEWWRFGNRFEARVYEPQGMPVSPALADVLVLALEDRAIASPAKASDRVALDVAVLEAAIAAAEDLPWEDLSTREIITAAICYYEAHTRPEPVIEALTVDEVEQIICRTEPPSLSDKGDKVWTRRMAVALANTFNARIIEFARRSAIASPAKAGDTDLMREQEIGRQVINYLELFDRLDTASARKDVGRFVAALRGTGEASSAERELHATVRKFNCDNAEQFWTNIGRLYDRIEASEASKRRMEEALRDVGEMLAGRQPIYVSLSEIIDAALSDSPASASEASEASEALRSAERALRPFYNAVFNDNGDITVSDNYDYEEAIAGYFAYRKVEAALQSAASAQEETGR